MNRAGQNIKLVEGNLSCKLALLMTILFMCFSSLKAQQEPHYTQYMFNMMSVNPAYAGTKEALNAIWLSRLQWVGVEGAPHSHSFTLHAPIKEKRIGIGASIITDRIGPETNTYFNLNYAHRFNVTESIKLSLGLKGGIYNYYVGLSKLETLQQDNAFTEDYQKNLQPNVGAGLYLFTGKYYFGFSIPKFLETELKEVNENDEYLTQLKRHYFTTAGMVFKLNSMWKGKPSVFVKLVEGAPISVDASMQFIYNDRIWFGATYRNQDAIAGMFQLQINKQIMLGYSYDYTLSTLSNVSNGSHELLISYDFVNFKNDKVVSPRHF